MRRVIVHIERLAIRGFSYHEGHALGRDLQRQLVGDVGALLAPSDAPGHHYTGLDPGRKIVVRSGADACSIGQATARAISAGVRR